MSLAENGTRCAILVSLPGGKMSEENVFLYITDTNIVLYYFSFGLYWCDLNCVVSVYIAL